jgi:drug/metabolite transporter (DMT)-like permease
MLVTWAFLAAIFVTMSAYGAYRHVKPSAPAHHRWFLSAAVLIMICGTYFLYAKSGVLRGFPAAALLLALHCAVGYAFYCLVMRLSPKQREFVATLTLITTAIGLPAHVFGKYHELAYPPCCMPGSFAAGATWNVQGTPALNALFDVPVRDRCASICGDAPSAPSTGER